MDYKEEYQKALERAKKGLPIDEVFPELKESEDERIRKHIIEILERLSPCHWDGNEKSECIAYLEKLEPAKWLDGDMKEARENLIVCCRDWERGVDTTLLPIVATRAKYFLEHLQQPAECWRPSIEQMAMLRAVINDDHNMASASANLALNSLYDDLIKL